jgi:hypothetical protein
MSSSTAGRKAVVYWSATNGASSYHLIAGIDTVSGGPESPEITDDEFGIQYEQSLTGVIGLKFTMSGGSRLGSDTNGQDSIMAANIAGTSPNGYIAVIFDSSAGTKKGWKAAVNITKIAPDTKVRDKTNISIEGMTTGAFLQFGTVTLP